MTVVMAAAGRRPRRRMAVHPEAAIPIMAAGLHTLSQGPLSIAAAAPMAAIPAAPP
jgi:hypothetical protein